MRLEDRITNIKGKNILLLQGSMGDFFNKLDNICTQKKRGGVLLLRELALMQAMRIFLKPRVILLIKADQSSGLNLLINSIKIIILILFFYLEIVDFITRLLLR